MLKNLLFRHSCRTKITSPLSLKMGQEVPKNLISIPGLIFSLDDRSADGRKHTAKMREVEISHCCDGHFSLGGKHILKT